MATRTWTGGTGTWDATDGTHWSASTAPVAGDAVVFDGTSGGGTVTVAADVAGIAFLSLTAGAFTGTLAFNTNNPNMSFTSFVSLSGAGTRTINLGSGTWTISGTTTGTIWDVATVTGLSPTFSNAAIVISSSAVNRTFSGGGQTYGALTIGNNSVQGLFSTVGTNTFASVSVGSGVTLIPVSTTISGALAITGTSSAPSGLISGSGVNATTVTVGSASTITWAGIAGITKAGAGSITATNSLDMGRNTGVTITAPSGGGSSGGQRVFSG